jgi:hypothetical protein
MQDFVPLSTKESDTDYIHLAAAMSRNDDRAADDFQ